MQNSHCTLAIEHRNLTAARHLSKQWQLVLAIASHQSTVPSYSSEASGRYHHLVRLANVPIPSDLLPFQLSAAAASLSARALFPALLFQPFLRMPPAAQHGVLPALAHHSSVISRRNPRDLLPTTPAGLTTTPSDTMIVRRRHPRTQQVETASAAHCVVRIMLAQLLACFGCTSRRSRRVLQ